MSRLNTPDSYGESGGPSIEACHSNKLSSFNHALYNDELDSEMIKYLMLGGGSRWRSDSSLVSRRVVALMSLLSFETVGTDASADADVVDVLVVEAVARFVLALEVVERRFFAGSADVDEFLRFGGISFSYEQTPLISLSFIFTV